MARALLGPAPSAPLRRGRTCSRAVAAVSCKTTSFETHTLVHNEKPNVTELHQHRIWHNHLAQY